MHNGNLSSKARKRGKNKKANSTNEFNKEREK